MFVLSDQLELPFSQWSRQMVLSWLDDLGLGHYSSQCGKMITCGQDLLKASPAQLERDLGLKNPLHRKKLQLALQVHWLPIHLSLLSLTGKIFWNVSNFAYLRNTCPCSSMSVLNRDFHFILHKCFLHAITEILRSCCRVRFWRKGH